MRFFDGLEKGWNAVCFCVKRKPPPTSGQWLYYDSRLITNSSLVVGVPLNSTNCSACYKKHKARKRIPDAI